MPNQGTKFIQHLPSCSLLITFLPRGICPHCTGVNTTKMEARGSGGRGSPSATGTQRLLPAQLPPPRPPPPLRPEAAHHFLQQHVAIFGQFDISGTRHQPAGGTRQVSGTPGPAPAPGPRPAPLPPFIPPHPAGDLSLCSPPHGGGGGGGGSSVPAAHEPPPVSLLTLLPGP